MTLLLSILLLTNIVGKDLSLQQVRETFAKAVEDVSENKKLLTSLEHVNVSQPVLLAYKGAAVALMAKHSYNPYAKLSFLSKSQKILEEAVTASPKDIEIRFLRFSIEHYVPSFLGYSKHLEEDRLAIVENINQYYFKERDIVINVAKFMIASERCTKEEIQILNKYVR
ncbi:MAG: hypothetical protein ACK4ND_10905 [Cytophagaceae bacterium]